MGVGGRRLVPKEGKSAAMSIPILSEGKSQASALATFILLTLFLSSSITEVEAIDCFKCVSINGSNPACEDPFHNNFTADILESPCMGGRKGRNGLFPATSCIKLSGTYGDTGVSLVVRGCALDSGTLTTDTEIIRMSHCGGLYFDNRYVNGCLQSCDDGDGCNSSSVLSCSSLLVQGLALFSLIIHII